MSDFFHTWLDHDDTLERIPLHQVNSTGWVIEEHSFYNTQWVNCFYPISGGYGPTSRYIYYIFLEAAVILRDKEWAATTALGLAMTYSSTAALHAIILFVLLQTRTPDRSTTEYVQVGGSTFAGQMAVQDGHYIQTNRTSGELWLPVAFMAWDDDSNAVLAILQTAFLTLLPMHMWSPQIRNASKGKKILLKLWGCLLFVGYAFSFAHASYGGAFSIPQLWFCPKPAADSLPLKAHSSFQYPGRGEPGDRYHWNRILGDEFVYKNSSYAFPDRCLYPSLGFDWPLRDPEDIIVSEIEHPRVLVGWSNGMTSLLLTFTPALTYAIAVVFARFLYNGDHKLFDIATSLRSWNSEISLLWKHVWERPPERRSCSHFAHVIMYLSAMYYRVYVMYLSPLVLLFFIISFEAMLSQADLGLETFRHVGQWGAVVGAGLVIVYAVASHFFESRLRNRKEPPICLHGTRSWWRHQVS